MVYIRREFYTKDKAVQQIIDRLMVHKVVELPPKMAQDLGRNRTIRNIRDMDRQNPYILIGLDRKYNTSIITIREPLHIKKNGDKYHFSFY